MDIDTPANPDLSSVAAFGASFPLPFRVLFLVGAGIACWAVNLHILHVTGIDAAHALDIRLERFPSFLSSPPSPVSSPVTSTSFSHSANLHSPVYKIFRAYTTWSFAGWAIFRLLTGGERQNLDRYKFIPALTALGAVCILMYPWNIVQKRERLAFMKAIIRCVISPFNQPTYFCDVILADIFTSFAKVLGDVWICIYMLSPSGSLSRGGEASWASDIAVPLLMSLPYIIRLRQCLIDYYASNHQSKRSLFNAVKYATAFPVILLSAAQKVEVSVSPTGGSTLLWDHKVWALWLVAVFVNSIYSFWWDVTNDWGLSLVRSSPAASHNSYATTSVAKLISLASTPVRSRSQSVTEGSTAPSTPSYAQYPPLSQSAEDHTLGSTQYFGLRPQLLFRDPVIYYAAILLNFILRFTWSLKLSSHLHVIAELEQGVFLMEALELIRRWMWVYIRVEWEVVKKSSADDDIPLRTTMRERSAELERIPFRDRDDSDQSVISEKEYPPRTPRHQTFMPNSL